MTIQDPLRASSADDARTPAQLLSDRCSVCVELTSRSAEWTDEDAHVVAMAATRVRAFGSLMVAPKRHVGTSLDLMPDEAVAFLQSCRASAALLERALSPQGLHVWWNTGELAGQWAEHVVAEVIPRYENDGFGLMPQLRDWSRPMRSAFVERVTRLARSRPRNAQYQLPEVGECGLCGYATGRLTWEPVIVTASSAVFVNVRQRSKGALIVMPIRHLTRLTELNASETADIAVSMHRSMAAITETFRPDAFHVWSSAGTIVGQSQPHFHFQIVPRYKDVDYSLAPSGQVPITPRDVRLQQAALLREACHMGLWPPRLGI